MAPKLVELIESGEANQEEIDFVVQEHINKFDNIDTLIL
jgi:glutamate racemase